MSRARLEQVSAEVYAGGVGAAVEPEATFLAPGWDQLLEGIRREGRWAIERTREGLQALPSYPDVDGMIIRSRLGRQYEALLAGLELRRRPLPSD